MYIVVRLSYACGQDINAFTLLQVLQLLFDRLYGYHSAQYVGHCNSHPPVVHTVEAIAFASTDPLLILVVATADIV